MSKPLTIDELKALETGDWVYIKRLYADYSVGTYYELGTQVMSEKYIVVELGRYERYNFSYSDYGTKWVAYKNKEQAERQTKYNVGDTVWYLQMKGYGCTSEEVMEIVVNSDIVKRIYAGKTKTTYYLKNISCGIDEKYLYKSEREAQQRLKELQGK